MVEHDLAKVGAAGSSPVFRSTKKAAESGLLVESKNCYIFVYIVKDLITARVAESVDALDLKSSGHFDRAGSSPAPGTKELTHKAFLLKVNYLFPLSYQDVNRLSQNTRIYRG